MLPTGNDSQYETTIASSNGEHNATKKPLRKYRSGFF